MITRFAPTPSGYLHVGNAVNAQLVAWLAARARADIILRIDDMDAPRTRPEYVEDIFDTLAWLGIEWHVGPTDAEDFVQHHSMRQRTEYYRAELDKARVRGLDVYACRCSRSQLRGPAVGGCPGGCRDAGHVPTPGSTAMRVHVTPGTVVTVEGQDIPLAESMGDFVLWRREDSPAYQLASVIEDRDAEVSHVVRGQDLIPSTAAQLFLAPWLGAERLLEVDFRHHGLITADDGGKLSKSQLAAGGPIPRTATNRELVAVSAAALGAPLGIGPLD